MLRIINRTIAIFFLTSIFVHLSVYLGTLIINRPHKEHVNKEIIELVVIDEDSKPKHQQIVEQDKKRVNDEKDENAKFLSQFDQKVVKETRSANNGAFSNAAKPGMRLKGTPEVENAEEPIKKLTGDLPTLDKLKPTFSLTPKAEKENVEVVGENSQTTDHLKDIDKGLQTLLSTREFVYYSYYQRIREKLRAHWESMIREKVKKVFASGRSIASSRDRTTQVIIILNNQGSLVKVQIVGESGISDLDDAAVEAFRAAEPFPNPPDGIVETDGMIRIRWDFVLEARQPTGDQNKYASKDYE